MTQPFPVVRLVCTDRVSAGLARQFEFVPISEEFSDCTMRKSPETGSLLLIICVPQFEVGVLRRAAMLVCPKVLPQVFQRDRYLGVAEDWALRDLLHGGARALPVSVQDPDDVVAVLCLIAFIDRERFQHKKGKEVRDSRRNAFLNSSVIEQFPRSVTVT